MQHDVMRSKEGDGEVIHFIPDFRQEWGEVSADEAVESERCRGLDFLAVTVELMVCKPLQIARLLLSP